MSFKNTLKNILNNDSVIICTIYFFTYGLLALNNGIYWDDWTFWGVSDQGLREQLFENGNVGFYYIFSFLYKLTISPVLIRIIIFFLYLLTTFIIYNLLTDLEFVSEKMRLLISLSYFLFPVNSAKITISSFPYALLVFIFFLGFYFLNYYLRSGYFIHRVIFSILFFCSFLSNSLLVFYLIPILYFFYFHYSKKNSFHNLFKVSMGHVELFISPVLFWILKSKFFKPYGLFEDYNQITFQKILYAPLMYCYSFFYSLFEPINISFNKSVSILTYALIITLVIYSLIRHKKDHIGNKNEKQFLKVFMLGLVLFFCGVFAYNAVGQQPRLNDWSHRHQLLVPLGASFILFFGLKTIFFKLQFSKGLENFIYAFIMAGFIVSNINIFLSYQRDWYKQLSLIQHFKDSDVLKKNTSFIFINNTKNLDVAHNKSKRDYRFYEYSGLLKYTFNNENRFGVDKSRLDLFGIDKYRFLANYSYNNVSNYSFKEFDYYVSIENGDYFPKDRSVLKLMVMSVIDPEYFKKRIKRMVNLEYKKVE